MNNRLISAHRRIEEKSFEHSILNGVATVFGDSKRELRETINHVTREEVAEYLRFCRTEREFVTVDPGQIASRFVVGLA